MRKLRAQPPRKKHSGHQAARLDPTLCRRMWKLAVAGNQARDAIKLEDGRGLRLYIKKSGSAQWKQRVTIRGTGKRVEGGHGSYPFVSLSTARTKANEAYTLAMEGKNPFPGSRDAGVKTTVADAVRAYQARRVQAGRVKRSGADDKFKIFERHAGPIADRPVSTLTLAEAAALLEGIEADSAARIVRELLLAAMAWAKAEGLANGNAFTKADLEAKLPSRRRNTENQPAMPWRMIGEAWRLLTAPTTRAARRNAATLRLIVLAACRPREALDATWSEFDGLDGPAPVWRIPAARMKAGKAHAVPLSPEAVGLVRGWAAETGADMAGDSYLFDYPRTAGKASNFLSDAIKRQGLDDPRFADPETGKRPTAHGFRSSFSAWAIHNGDWPNDLVDAHLAHSKGAVSDAYLRDGQESPRRRMMVGWGAEVVRQVEAAGGILAGGGESHLDRALRLTEKLKAEPKRPGVFDIATQTHR